jgi:hypothetical protein
MRPLAYNATLVGRHTPSCDLLGDEPPTDERTW